jgi:hypothetical protein
MEEFTSLERAVLTAICAAQGERGNLVLRRLEGARIIDRDNTGHGFYTSFHVDRNHSPIPIRRISGPVAYMRDMGPGMVMGFVLWFKKGYPDCLEGYQFGGDGGDEVNLQDRNLADLDVERLEWPPAIAG